MEQPDRWVRVGHATGAAEFDAGFVAAGQAVGDDDPALLDCIARRSVLGDAGIKREIKRVAQHSSGAPVSGFYTHGAIGRTQGISGFHNQTLVVLAVS